MEKVEKVFNFIEAPNLIRDACILLGGLGSLLFFQLIHQIDVIAQFKSLGLERIETDFAILVGAYVFGRLLRTLAELAAGAKSPFKWLLQSVVFDPRSLQDQIGILKQNWKRLFKDWLGFGDFKSVSPREVRDEVTAMEMADVVKKYPLLGNERERQIYHMIFIDIAFSTSLIAGLFLNHYYFFVTASLFYLCWKVRKDTRRADYYIYRSVVKTLTTDK